MGQARASTENPAGCRRWCPFGARDGAGGGEPRVELLEELGVAAPGSCRWRRRGGRRQAVGAWWTPGTGWQGPGKQRKLEGAGPGDRRGGTVAMESPADTYKCLSHFLRVFSEETIG